MLRRLWRKIAIAAVVVGVLVGAMLLIAQDQDTLRIRTELSAEDPRFPLYLARLLGRPLLPTRDTHVYSSGAAAFDAMLGAIEGANERISFETYIFDAGEVAARFTTALAAAARRGVRVSMVLDAVGASAMDATHRRTLEDAGVQIGWFNPLSRYSLEELNYRTHRKILVTDGDRAFVGGIGIGDQWVRGSDGPPWRDTHIELDGPVAVAIEGGFNENWMETGGIVSPSVDPDPRAAVAPGDAIVEWSSPEGGANGMKLLYLLAIAAARRTLDIQSPYLIVDESSLWSLREARARGVQVRLLVEGDRTDALPVKYSGRADYERLLALGVDIAEYQPTMMHVKAMVVDGLLSIVGSANFDNRSLELNDELNVAVFDRRLAERLLKDFDADWQHSTVLRLDAWRERPITEKARAWFWGFFGEVF